MCGGPTNRLTPASGGLLGFIITSPDGVNWSEPYDPNFGGSHVSAVASNGTRHLVFGAVRVLASTDGVEWTDQGHQGLDVQDAIWANGLFIAVGSYGGIITSPDGLVWTKQVSVTSFSLWGVT